jgi:hypothetical protein
VFAAGIVVGLLVAEPFWQAVTPLVVAVVDRWSRR